MPISYKFDLDGETFVCGYMEDLTHLDNYHDIVTIDCSCNNLAELPTLPNSLVYLDCCFNRLSVLPTLPNSLEHLQCYYNLLTVLPTLPNSLVSLNCYQNKLYILPKLPNSLKYLNCYTNLLTVLPTLPISLKYLNCQDNLLAVLPKFKDNLNLKSKFYNDTPVNTYIRDKCHNNLEIYYRENKIFALKLANWFYDCKWNPKFKFCRDRLNKEYDDLFKEEVVGIMT